MFIIMEELSYKHISAEDFLKTDWKGITLVDLREPDELLVSGIEGAINIPFSGGFEKLDTIPKDKPVVVFCRVGDWSEQVADILSDRGYDVIDGVELGGVATFIGSGEESDMSLFI